MPLPPKPEVIKSPSLSLFARSGEDGIRTRRIAILVAEGVDAEAATRIHAELVSRGAVPRYVGMQLGTVTAVEGPTIDVEIPFEGGPSVLWDAVAVPGGADSISALAASGQVLEFLRDQFRHCKTMLLLDEATDLLERSDMPPDAPGIVTSTGDAIDDAIVSFVDALLKHRHYAREADPPSV